MADPTPRTYKYFKLSYPAPYVALVEIDRPEKMNAFIEPMWHEISRIFSTLSICPNTRAVILGSTSPRAFTTGLDISSPGALPFMPGFPSPSTSSSPQSAASQPTSSSNTANSHTSQKDTARPPASAPRDVARLTSTLIQHIHTFQSHITTIAHCRKPVLCALSGYVYGLGIDIAVCADIRICHVSTRFSVKEVDIGIAADVGTLSRLGKVVGSGSWVKDVCLTGREWRGKEAGAVGFCNSVVDTGKGEDDDVGKDGMGKGEGREERLWREREGVMKEALRQATLIAEKSPIAVQGTKEILDWSRDRSVEDGLRYTAVWNGAMIQTEDVRRAIEAGKGRRKAVFEKL